MVEPLGQWLGEQAIGLFGERRVLGGIAVFLLSPDASVRCRAHGGSGPARERLCSSLSSRFVGHLIRRCSTRNYKVLDVLRCELILSLAWPHPGGKAIVCFDEPSSPTAS